MFIANLLGDCLKHVKNTSNETFKGVKYFVANIVQFLVINISNIFYS